MAYSVVASVAHELGSLLVTEAKNLIGVRGKIKGLKDELIWMHSFLEDADNKHYQDKVVSMWVSEIRDFTYETRYLIERYVHQVSRPRQSGFRNGIKWYSRIVGNALTLHDLGSRIDALRTRLQELTNRLPTYGIQCIPQLDSSIYVAIKEQRRTYSHIEENPVGLEEHTQRVVDQIVCRNNEVKVVGISGMGGLGKTTLARKVYSEKSVKECFDNNLVWIYVSKVFERRNVFEEILLGLSRTNYKERKKIKDLTNEELPRKICEVLEEIKCLIVLDDIWSNEDWNTLMPAFQTIKGDGSKILITTRDKGLCKHGYSYPFGHLSENDSWRLLQQKAFSQGDDIDDEVKNEKERLGKEMLKHCEGLPLAIVALGGLLATKRTVHEWETVQMNIASYLMSDMCQQNKGDNVLPVLELSFYDLPFYLKPCFMYLATFPEDFEIPTERLYHLWEAEGFVTTSSEGANIRGVSSLDDVAELYLDQLVERSMVHPEKCWPNGRVKTCRLHDVMRDMCLKKCEEVNFLSTLEYGVGSKEIGENSHLVNRKVRRCTVYLRDKKAVGNSPFQTDVNEVPCISSLLVFPYGCGDVVSLLSRNTNLFLPLQVLDIEGTSIQQLPEEIGDSIHLRYLSLRRTWISDLPASIWECKYLETLDLRSDNYLELSNELWKLERLKHLYLPRFLGIKDNQRLKLSPNQVIHLETLKNCDNKQCEMEGLVGMENLRVFSFTGEEFLTMTELELLFKSPVIATGRLVNPLRLTIMAQALDEEPTILTTLKYQLCMNRLGIRGRIELPIRSDDDTANIARIFPHTLTRVILLNCEIGGNIVSELERLPRLNELVLMGRTAIKGSKMSFSDESFPCLAMLCLDHIEELEEWEVGKGALPNLRQLFIYGCYNLRKIPECVYASVLIPTPTPKLDKILCLYNSRAIIS